MDSANDTSAPTKQRLSLKPPTPPNQNASNLGGSKPASHGYDLTQEGEDAEGKHESTASSQQNENAHSHSHSHSHAHSHSHSHSHAHGHGPGEHQGNEPASHGPCTHNSSTYLYSPRGFQEADFESFDVESFGQGIDRLLAGAVAVDFDEAEVDDEKMQRIIEALQGQGCKCRWLSLYDVSMEESTVDAFAEILRQGSHMKAVNLSGYPLPLDILRGIDPDLDVSSDKDEQLALYMEAEGKGLDLSMEKYGWMECRIMAHLLHENDQLEELILSESKLDARCIRELTRGLLHNRALRILTLAHNQIGSDGAVLLAEYLMENKMLLELDVDDNGIDDRGATALGGMLRANTTLLSLKIRKNNFNVAILTEALKENPHIIDFACDGITEEMLTEVGFVTNNDAVVIDVNNPQSLLG